MNRLIALVEDNPKEAEDIFSHFRHLASDTEEHFDIKWFKTGGEFLSSYQPVYDMVLLDINLSSELTGMDVAKFLRKLDSHVVLLFVTSLAQYAVEGYEVSALDFMVKPVNYSTFKRKIERALSHCVRKQGEDIILNLLDGVSYRTSPSRIKYIEIQGHSIIIHSTEGNLEAYGSLKQLESELDANQFVRCHRSFLVNLSYVRAIHGLTVLVGDEELPVAKLKRAEFMQALNKYLGGGN